jgi:hypothetical protein
MVLKYRENQELARMRAYEHSIARRTMNPNIQAQDRSLNAQRERKMFEAGNYPAHSRGGGTGGGRVAEANSISRAEMKSLGVGRYSQSTIRGGKPITFASQSMV